LKVLSRALKQAGPTVRRTISKCMCIFSLAHNKASRKRPNPESKRKGRKDTEEWLLKV
jgi:hypothetical protein